MPTKIVSGNHLEMDNDDAGYKFISNTTDTSKRWHVVLGGCGDLAGVLDHNSNPICMLGKAAALNPAHVAKIIEAPELVELVRDALDDGCGDFLWQVRAEAVLQRIAEFRMPAADRR